MSRSMSSRSRRPKRVRLTPNRFQPRLPTSAPGRAGTEPGRTVLRASTPEDLLGLVPALMHFHPSESLVVLALNGKRVGLTARIDLPGSNGLPEEPEQWRPTLLHMLAAVRQQRPTSVALVGYSERSEVVSAALWAAIDTLVDGPQPIPISEAVRTDGSRWWSLLCQDKKCCSSAGTPYDPSKNRIAAEAVFAGMTVLRDRKELEAVVDGPAAADEADLLELLDGAGARLDPLPRSERMQRMQTLVELGTHLSLDPSDDPDEVVRTEPLSTAALLELVALSADLTVRDVAWAAIDRENADAHVRLWQSVVAVTPARSAVAPVCLLGAAAWIAGQGALLVCAVERASELDPDYTLIEILAEILDRAIPPSAWEDIAGELRQELGVA